MTNKEYNICCKYCKEKYDNEDLLNVCTFRYKNRQGTLLLCEKCSSADIHPEKIFQTVKFNDFIKYTEFDEDSDDESDFDMSRFLRFNSYETKSRSPKEEWQNQYDNASPFIKSLMDF